MLIVLASLVAVVVQMSKPRWVLTDGGVALPQRRALFGRWYMGALLAVAVFFELAS